MDHIHPSDTSKASLSGATFTGAINLAASTGIIIPTGAPTVTTDTLYQVGSSLYFNGTALSGGITLSSPLTGFTLGTDGTALASTDTILQGFQKLQVQSNNKANLSGDTFTGSVAISDATASTSTTTGALKVSGGLGVAGNSFIGGKLNLASISSSTVNGDIWSDSTRESITTFISGIQQSLTGCIFTQTTDKTIATTTGTDLDITGTGVGTKTLPANFFVVGKYLRIQIQGVYTSTSTASNITCKLKFGSTTIASTVACAGGTSKTNQNFTVELTIGCKSIGTSGTVTASGAFKWASGDTTNNEIRIACTTTTIDTTASQAISVTLKNSANGFITTSKNMYIEVLN